MDRISESCDKKCKKNTFCDFRTKLCEHCHTICHPHTGDPRHCELYCKDYQHNITTSTPTTNVQYTTPLAARGSESYPFAVAYVLGALLIFLIILVVAVVLIKRKRCRKNQRRLRSQQQPSDCTYLGLLKSEHDDASHCAIHAEEPESDPETGMTKPASLHKSADYVSTTAVRPTDDEEGDFESRSGPNTKQPIAFSNEGTERLESRLSHSHSELVTSLTGLQVPDKYHSEATAAETAPATPPGQDGLEQGQPPSDTAIDMPSLIISSPQLGETSMKRERRNSSVNVVPFSRQTTNVSGISRLSLNLMATSPEDLGPSAPFTQGPVTAGDTTSDMSPEERERRWRTILQLYDLIDLNMAKLPFIAGCMIGSDSLQVCVRSDENLSVDTCYELIRKHLPKDNPLIAEVLVVIPESALPRNNGDMASSLSLVS